MPPAQFRSVSPVCPRDQRDAGPGRVAPTAMCLDTLPDATSRCLRKMPPAFSAALFEQIFALRGEGVVLLRRAATTREDAEKRALKSVRLGLPTGSRAKKTRGYNIRFMDKMRRILSIVTLLDLRFA